jgi:hypothetical protein
MSKFGMSMIILGLSEELKKGQDCGQCAVA